MGGGRRVSIDKSTLAITHVESLGSRERLAIVQSLYARKNVEIPLDQFRNFDEVSPALESGAVETPSGLECLAGGLDGDIDVRRETFGERGDDLARRRVDSAVAGEVSGATAGRKKSGGSVRSR